MTATQDWIAQLYDCILSFEHVFPARLPQEVFELVDLLPLQLNLPVFDGELLSSLPNLLVLTAKGLHLGI